MLEKSSGHDQYQRHVPAGNIDFSSSDYLGIRKNNLVRARLAGLEPEAEGLLLKDSDKLISQVEEMLASFHQAGAALLFESGYAASIGLLSCVPGRGDTIIYDEHIQPSLRDGFRLSMAEAYPFLHNDIDNLTYRLNRKKGTAFVVTESYFCCSGETIPLPAMVKLCERYGAHLIVNETCCIGLRGTNGAGLVQELGLENRVFARTHSFSKILGTQGGVVLGTEKLKTYLLRYASNYLFSTSLTPEAIRQIEMVCSLVKSMDAERQKIKRLCQIFGEADLPFQKGHCEFPVQGIKVQGNYMARRLQRMMKERYIHTCNVAAAGSTEQHFFPFHFHAFNTEAELNSLIRAIRDAHADLPSDTE